MRARPRPADVASSSEGVSRSDRKDLEFFARFRIERSYLTDEHNEKFREELARRKREAAPASSLRPGDVAVECYGRQAERGGGWMAFHGAAGVETLELTPNSVGIWCAELAFDAAGGVVALVAIACSSAIFAAMPALPRPGPSATNATAL